MKLAPVRGECAAKQLERRGFSCAVATQDGKYFALLNGKVKALYNVPPVLFVAEPQLLCRYHGLARRLCGLLGHRGDFVVPGVFGEKRPALGDGHGAVGISHQPRPNAHGGGHGIEHRVLHSLECPADSLDIAAADDFALVHDGAAVGHGKCLLKALLGQEHARA